MRDDGGHANVYEVILLLNKLVKDGKGNYIVGCNNEYIFAEKDEEPMIDDKNKTVDFGGYC